MDSGVSSMKIEADLSMSALSFITFDRGEQGKCFSFSDDGRLQEPSNICWPMKLAPMDLSTSKAPLALWIMGYS